MKDGKDTRNRRSPIFEKGVCLHCVFSGPFISAVSTQIMKQSVMIAVYLGQRESDSIQLMV